MDPTARDAGTELADILDDVEKHRMVSFGEAAAAAWTRVESMLQELLDVQRHYRKVCDSRD